MSPKRRKRKGENMQAAVDAVVDGIFASSKTIFNTSDYLGMVRNSPVSRNPKM